MIVIAPALWLVGYFLRLPAACHSLHEWQLAESRKALILPKFILSAGANFSQKVCHILSKWLAYIITKWKFCSCILLWKKVSTWLNLIFSCMPRKIHRLSVRNLLQFKRANKALFANATPSADISICPILKLVRRGFSLPIKSRNIRMQFP